MARPFLAGLVYFAMVFAAGFLLGAVRTIWLVPLTGPTAAVLFELPIMLLVSWAACGLAIRRVRPGNTLPRRLVMGGFAFFLLISAETALGLLLFGRTAAEQWASYSHAAGLLGLLAQLAFAGFPLLRDRHSG